MTYTELKNAMPKTYAALTYGVLNSVDSFLTALTVATENSDIFIDLITANHIEITCGNPDENMDEFTDLLSQMLLEIFRNNRKASYPIRKDGMMVFIFNHFTVAIDYNPNNFFDN